MVHELSIRPERYAVCRLAPDAATPAWAAGPIVATIRRPEEFTVVCAEDRVPGDVECSPGWAVIAVRGPLAHDLVGILAGLAGVLRDAGIPIFALSTFDTDLVLVPADRIDAAAAALHRAGHVVHRVGLG